MPPAFTPAALDALVAAVPESTVAAAIRALAAVAEASIMVVAAHALVVAAVAFTMEALGTALITTAEHSPLGSRLAQRLVLQQLRPPTTRRHITLYQPTVAIIHIRRVDMVMPKREREPALLLTAAAIMPIAPAGIVSLGIFG